VSAPTGHASRPRPRYAQARLCISRAGGGLSSTNLRQSAQQRASSFSFLGASPDGMSLTGQLVGKLERVGLAERRPLDQVARFSFVPRQGCTSPVGT
jgi:hypothetical protein